MTCAMIVKISDGGFLRLVSRLVLDGLFRTQFKENYSRFMCQSQAGHLEVKDKSGMTVEGLQEYYDEACLVVKNNK